MKEKECVKEMSENEIIAQYVKERFPELLNSTDFVLYKLGLSFRKIVDDFKEAVKNIDFSKIGEQLKEMRCDNEGK